MKRFFVWYGIIMLTLTIPSRVSGTPKLLRGTVRDRETMRPLPVATLFLQHTTRGAISNSEGGFSLAVDSLPALLSVRYIGYQNLDMEITASSPDSLDLSLIPAPIHMQPVLVSPENLGMKIMRQVIEHKKVWHSRLHSYQAEAYSRNAISNDTGIVFLSEIISDLHWKSELGYREVIRSKKQTSNINPAIAISSAMLIPNLYDDDIDLMGYDLIGVTHPEALNHYRFEVIGERVLDNRRVYDIQVQSTGDLQPVFEGRLAVQDSSFILVEAELKPASYLRLPKPVKAYQVELKQKFRIIRDSIPMPISLELSGSLKAGMIGLSFPTFHIHSITQVNRYHLNLNPPDSLYQGKRHQIQQITSSTPDSILSARQDLLPLSSVEKQAYLAIDTGLTLTRAFQPKGWLSGHLKMEARINDQSMDAKNAQTSAASRRINLSHGGAVWYNRVDGLHLEPRINLGLGRELSSRWGVGYNTASQDWDWQIAGTYRIPGCTGLSLLANAQQFTDIQGDHDIYGRLVPSLLPLQGRREYWNYFRNRKLEAGLMLAPPSLPLRVKTLLSQERQRSVDYATDYHLVGSRSSTLNCPIPEGDLNALKFEVTGFDRQNAPHPLVPEFNFQVEYTDRSWLNSDFSYQRYSGRLIWQVNTFYSRYLQPNYLRIMLMGGTGRGDLPPQRYGSLDGNLLTYSPFGVFHTRLNHPYQGDRWMAIYAKHNFRAIPFQWMGMEWAARRNWQLIVHAAAGRAWIHEQSKPEFHQEIGLSLVNIIPWVQLDVSRRLDQRGWVFSFSFHFN